MPPTSGSAINLGSPEIEKLRDQPELFVPRFASIFLHELTHVRDVIKMGHVVAPEDNREAYYNSDHEVRAYGRQIVEDVIIQARFNRDVRLAPTNEQLVERALANSQHWLQVEPWLTDENKENIYRFVYRGWSGRACSSGPVDAVAQDAAVAGGGGRVRRRPSPLRPRTRRRRRAAGPAGRWIADPELLSGVDFRGELRAFGASDIVGLVNAEPAAVYYGVRVEAHEGATRMAAEAPRAKRSSMQFVDQKLSPLSRAAKTPRMEPDEAYSKADRVYRFAAVDTGAPPPNEDERYFHDWPGTHRDSIIPGAAPGTVAFIDWHYEPQPRETPNVHGIYIDYIRTRHAERGKGIAEKLTRAFYEHLTNGGHINDVYWGRVVTDHAWHIMKKMEAEFPKIHTWGKASFLGEREAREEAYEDGAEEAGQPGVKKGDTILQFPGIKARKGMSFTVKPRGQRFQWTPEKPRGLTAFPEVKKVLVKQREGVPSLESIRMAAIFAGLTVHAGTSEA